MPESAAHASAGASAGPCGCGSKPAAGMPVVTFSTFILSLSSSALCHMGEVPDPGTGQNHEDLDLAKHTIDVLAMLKDKTSRCLDPDEARLLDGLLYELRLKYVAKCR